jgi:putative phosphonate metabolism protein
MTIQRYAIYYAPRPESALHRLGKVWLGVDPETGRRVPIRLPQGLDHRRHEEITAGPRHYTLHGTLKPPFRLAPGTDPTDLKKAVAALAARLAPVSLGPPVLTRLGGFLALCPAEQPRALLRLAAACVEAPDRFRAPPSHAELEKRRAAGLSARQEELLQSWGYPYVMEEFRFHITLTGRLSMAEQDRVAEALAPMLDPVLSEPMAVEDLCLYGEPDDGSPLRLLARFPLKQIPSS